MTAAADIAWSSRWRAIRPNATYNASWGLEGAWRGNADEWGYPFEDGESDIDHNGKSFKGRTFSKIGVVCWDPSNGPVIVGWP